MLKSKNVYIIPRKYIVNKIVISIYFYLELFMSSFCHSYSAFSTFTINDVTTVNMTIKAIVSVVSCIML